MAQLEGIETDLWPSEVAVMDVAPRDGLQNEPNIMPTAQKIHLIETLARAGVTRIQATSFVSAKAVPQLADAAEVAAGIKRLPGVRYFALVPNEKGYDRAVASGVEDITLVLSATETMNQNNINMSIAESMGLAQRLFRRAKDDGLNVRADVAVAFVCAFEGTVDCQTVVDQVDELFALGADQVCLADTTGRADPRHAAKLFALVRKKHGCERLAGHFHDTLGMGLANTVAAMQQGIAFFDTAIGGLGGCPFTPGATGNVSTEDVVSMLNQMGIKTTIDLDRLCKATDLVKEFSGSKLPSAYYRSVKSGNERSVGGG